jgi:hypothetical protein
MDNVTTPPPRPGRPTRAQRIERLRLALAREVSREKEEARRRDTRRKIVLGSALIALFQKPDFSAASKQKIAALLLSLVAERDRPDVSAFLATLLPPESCQQNQ